ncbi:MAG: sugar ABC transporter substrate-binding protein [Pseudolabrys sp.]|nr:sugar ABC transporter substrate-binding protein [Pseudolabrys sp.]
MTLGLGLAVSVASAGLALAQKHPTIAVFTKNFTNPAYEAFRIGAEKVARAANARVIHYVPKRPDSIAEQTAAVGQALNDRPDIVLFTPVDDEAMAGPVKRLNDANIPIVLFTNRLPGKFITYIGSDDVELGYKEAVYLFRHMGGKGRIVILEGVPAAPTSRDRLIGYRHALAEFPGITVLASGIGNYQRPDGRDVMAGMLKDHATIDAVLAANDSMALGALDALQAANRSAIVMSINGIIEAVRQVEAGAMLATVDFNMFKIACIATQAALRHLKDEKIPDRITLPTEIIDKTNYPAWLVPVADRPCPKWEDFVT